MSAPVPDGSVIIPPAQVYEKVVTLTEVVTKLVAADEAEANDRAELRARVGELEKDVSAIKQKLWFVAGICSAAGGGLGSALASALAG
ncbi:hypothetical protein [Nocardioides sp. J54]|uniref:hypothetical protein n=1 Tax=Nocardioides sp. J54 TaxID=935866 RepID=UPI0004BAD47A|nr:hypothetical protein [Nocardioides sp. J54]